MSEYNGWKNYETWCVDLWLSNDQGNYADVLGMAEQFIVERDAAELEGDAHGVWLLADRIQAYVEDLPEYLAATAEASFVTDLIGASMNAVDWSEIAEGWIAAATD